MYYFRLVIAFAAMVLSWFCFENADVPAIAASRTQTAEETVVTEEMQYNTVDTETGFAVIDNTAAAAVMLANESYMYDDHADPMMMQTVAELEEQEAERRAEEARIRAEEEQRRIAEQKRKAAEAKRKAAAEKAAKEAAREKALKAACPGYDEAFIATLTKEEQAEARYFYEQGYVFYRQNWSVLDDAAYGNEGFGLCGCGPTCVAAIISNLAGVPVDPEEMRVYGLSVGSWLPSGGTTYGFIIETAKKYGITATQIYAGDKESLFAALKDDNKLVLATMGPGDFTLGAHFMLFRGVTDEGKILIADSYSYEYSTLERDYDYLYAQLKSGYWIFEKTE